MRVFIKWYEVDGSLGDLIDSWEINQIGYHKKKIDKHLFFFYSNEKLNKAYNFFGEYNFAKLAK